jgi:predicted nucleic acid-binding protein
VRSFADTNIAVYAESQDGEKSAIAWRILNDGPVISTQVVNETIAVLSGKYGFSRAEAYEVALALMDQCDVEPTDEETVRDAMELAERYHLSHWDALIVAAALRAGCDILYSEDLQHGQVFFNRLTVRNPFSGSPSVQEPFVHVTHARYVRDYVVWMSFNDGTAGYVDLLPELQGPVFGPLNDVEQFRRFSVAYHTLVWPNGADFAPEFLRERISASA